jgi:hypothetical protein
MDNLGRDMQRMMWLLFAGGILAGAAGAGACIWLLQRLARG